MRSPCAVALLHAPAQFELKLDNARISEAARRRESSRCVQTAEPEKVTVRNGRTFAALTRLSRRTFLFVSRNLPAMRLAFCCVGRAQGPGYVGCLSTLPYSDNPVLQDYGSFSNDIALLLDAIAPAIDDATSKATFCTNLGGALDSVNLPATNACLQEFSQTLEEFGCNTGSAGV